LESQFKAALPAHIPAERFMRVLMTAIQNNPALFNIDRRSLWNAAMRAAQDGLLADGRDGAIVVYKSKNGPVAQWMPMIAGLRKKVRNSGEIATWDAQVVREKDRFEFRLGDDPLIVHQPSLDPNPGAIIAAYSIATLKTGEKSREVMSVADIERIRRRSRAR
jgi:recombination protein RecT